MPKRVLRILVIGGTGFIGPHIVTRLVDMGNEVAVFHRGKNNEGLPNKVKHILGDRKKLADFSEEFKRFAPNVVLDMISFTEDDAKIFMSTFKGITQRVAVVSSQDVYQAYGILLGIESGPLQPIPLAEDAPLRQKLYPYRGETPRTQDDPQRWVDSYEKILVEQTIMKDPELPGTILRLPMVYGPRDGQHRLFEYLKRMSDNRPAILLDERLAHWHWTRGYVENIAAAVSLAVTDDHTARRIYNLGETATSSMAEWVKKIGDHAGWKGKVVVVPKDQTPQHLRAKINCDQHLVTDTTRIRKEIGYTDVVTLDEALNRTIAWEKSHPPAKYDPNDFNYAIEDSVLADLDKQSKVSK